MRIGFTGTQKGMTGAQRESFENSILEILDGESDEFQQFIPPSDPPIQVPKESPPGWLQTPIPWIHQEGMADPDSWPPDLPADASEEPQ